MGAAVTVTALVPGEAAVHPVAGFVYIKSTVFEPAADQ
jgi:hypothetical protein